MMLPCEIDFFKFRELNSSKLGILYFISVNLQLFNYLFALFQFFSAPVFRQEFG